MKTLKVIVCKAGKGVSAHLPEIDGFVIARETVEKLKRDLADGLSFHIEGLYGTVTFAPDAEKKVREYAGLDMELHRIAAECSKYGKAGIRAKLERTNHHYSHENTITCYTEDGEYALPCVGGTCRSLMQWLYRQLEKEYEYRSGEECFLENAAANEWTFTEQGKIETE